MSWLLYIIVGFASGIVSGMGIGGGAILIPALTIFLDIEQQKAQNINLLYYIPTALIALRVHKKEGNIEKKGLTPLILCAIPGTIAGALIAINIDANYLRKGFAVFLLCMAIYELKKGLDRRKSQNSKGTC
ncbi:MAG: sulfite exporter TauE/SafE family protein [Defluviitaleaceae bacterium]|nr:sulfite exporter TauE/SafE family protein [Defluviitaleaceae bacterium]